MARNLKVEARLVADTGSYTAGIRKALADTDRFGRATKKAGRGDVFGGLAKNALKAAAATASLYTAYDQGKKAVNTTLELAKSTKALTRTTGLSTQEASRFVAVAKVRGIENTKLAASFTILSKQIVAAQKGSEASTAAFQKLGVSQEAIKRGDTKQVFMDAADGLSKMANGANKTALAAQLFGRGYQALFPLLDMGSKGIAEQLELAGSLGAELSGKGQDSVLKFAEAQRKAKLAQMGLQVQLGQVLIPLLTKGVAALSDFISQFRKGTGAGGEFRSSLEAIRAVLAPLARLLADHPALLVGAAAAYVAFKSTVAGLNLFNAITTALGSTTLYSAAGTVRGVAFGTAFGRAVQIGGVLGLVALPVLVATVLERIGAVFQQWATRNMGPELKRLLGVPLTLNPLENFKMWFQDLKSEASVTWGFVKRIFSSNPLAANPFGRMSQWWNAIKSGAKGAWDFIKKLFGGGGSSNILGTIQAPRITGLDGLASSVKSAVSAAVKAGAAFGERFASVGKQLIQDLAKGMRGMAASVASAAASVVSKAYARARGLIGQFFGVGQSIGSQLASGVRSTFDQVINSITEAINRAKQAAQSAKGSVGAKGSSARGSRRVGVRGASDASNSPMSVALSGFLQDPITGGSGLDPQLVLEQERLAKAEAAVEKAKRDAGEKRSKAESRRIKALQSEARNAQNAVASLEKQITRRDALVGIKDQLRGFVDQAAQAFSEVRQQAAQAALDSANSIAAGVRDAAAAAAEGARNAAFARLDESTGDSPEAQRLRALRAEDERLTREREDKTYTANKTQLEAELAKATANGNVRKQTELNAQLLELEAQRGDTLRTREETELSASLQRQRDAAQTAYDDKIAQVNKAYDDQIAKNQALYDDTVAKNAAATEDFKTNLNAQLTAEFDALAARKKNYADFAAAVAASLAAAGIAGSFTPSSGDEGAIQSPSGGGGGKKDDKKKKDKKKKRASGGFLSRAGLTLVGETGPELISGANVYSATRTARMSGAGVTLNVYPQTTADDPVQLARALGWQLATR